MSPHVTTTSLPESSSGTTRECLKLNPAPAAMTDNKSNTIWSCKTAPICSAVGLKQTFKVRIICKQRQRRVFNEKACLQTGLQRTTGLVLIRQMQQHCGFGNRCQDVPGEMALTPLRPAKSSRSLLQNGSVTVTVGSGGPTEHLRKQSSSPCHLQEHRPGSQPGKPDLKEQNSRLFTTLTCCRWHVSSLLCLR